VLRVQATEGVKYYRKPFEFLSLGIMAYVGNDRALTQVRLGTVSRQGVDWQGTDASAGNANGARCCRAQAKHPRCSQSQLISHIEPQVGERWGEQQVLMVPGFIGLVDIADDDSFYAMH